MNIIPSMVKISRHLAADQTEIFCACPVCGCKDERRKVGSIQMNPDIDLLECLRCHAVSASHLPSNKYLSNYYRDIFSHFYGVYNKTKKSDITFSAPDRFVKHLLKYLPFDKILPETAVHIIDFGGGDGTMGLLLARAIPGTAPIKVTVVDFGNNIARNEDDRIKLRKEENVYSFNEPADIVIASGSLEHVPNVEPVIRKLFSLIKPGGYFYARTPYIVPMKRIIKSIDFGYPAHVHDLGAEFWNGIAGIFGSQLSIIRSRPSVVQITFSINPLRWMIAHLMKFPAKIECTIFPHKNRLLWPFVGGWEIFLHKNITERIKK